MKAKKDDPYRETIVPLPTTALLPYGVSSKPPEELEFVSTALVKLQARFDGVTAFSPLIDLAAYRFRAVIDWVQIRVFFPKASNFRTVQDHLLKLYGCKYYVHPVNPGPGRACDTFDIKIQDPVSVRWVVEVSREIAAKFGEREEPLVSGVEFSLDAYPREPSDHARAMLLGVMQRTIFTHRDIVTKKASRPRSTTKSVIPETAGSNLPQAKKLQNRKLLIEGATGKPNYNYTVAENHRTPFIDGTMYFGAQKDDVMIKIMHKTIDEQKPAQKSSEATVKILSEIERRVRIEVTIQGKELEEIGLCNLADLQGFKFSKLQGRYFQFKLPTFRDGLDLVKSGASAALAEMEKRRAEIFLKSGVVGLNASEEERANERARMLPGMREAFRSEGRTLKRKRTGQGETGTFVAYAELNHLAVLAFRHLGDREGRAWTKKARSELL